MEHEEATLLIEEIKMFKEMVEKMMDKLDENKASQ